MYIQLLPNLEGIYPKRLIPYVIEHEKCLVRLRGIGTRQEVSSHSIKKEIDLVEKF
jgi:hypothetical protein